MTASRISQLFLDCGGLEAWNGQAAVVSTCFSQLMRRKGCVIFKNWQDAVDWLTVDILRYNLKTEGA